MLRISNRFNGRNWHISPNSGKKKLAAESESGYGSGEPFQLDPNDDDMDRIPRTVDIDQSRMIEQYDRERTHDHEFDYELYWRERDYYDNLQYERQFDQGLTWPERYSWEQYATVHPAFT